MCYYPKEFQEMRNGDVSLVATRCGRNVSLEGFSDQVLGPGKFPRADCLLAQSIRAAETPPFVPWKQNGNDF